MDLTEPVASAAWRAELELAYERRGDRSVLATRRHDGPLVVQKPLYPEGDAVCQTIIVHPPGGIAGGDALSLEVAVGARAQALLTTPGAGKWYRSAGPWARQALRFEVGAEASLEWLPQETIVFDAARADLSTEVRLAPGACFIGWEVLCLGRSGSGERFTRGELRTSTRLLRGEQPVWLERGRIAGGDALLESPVGLDGHTVSGTLLAAAPEIGANVVSACREILPDRGAGAITRLPGVLVARYLGDASEAARHWFVALWRLLRPALLQREAVEPRIWRT